ncbi:hypothetical protein TGVEG_440520, partial [Toxoplasma gondii VEG]
VPRERRPASASGVTPSTIKLTPRGEQKTPRVADLSKWRGSCEVAFPKFSVSCRDGGETLLINRSSHAGAKLAYLPRPPNSHQENAGSRAGTDAFYVFCTRQTMEGECFLETVRRLGGARDLWIPHNCVLLPIRRAL